MERTAKLQPWYHHCAPQCDAVIKRFGEQCVFTATHTGKGVNLCTTHAKMASFPMKLIKPARITIR
jgi:hypothetical protein